MEYLGRGPATRPRRYASIRFVRVRIVDYVHSDRDPVHERDLRAPEFSSTLPRESLGCRSAGAPPAC